MKEIHVIRRKNFNIILENFRTKAAFAAIAGMTPAQVTQLTSETKINNMGAAVARKIEIAAGKPDGWLDVEAGTNDLKDLDLIARTITLLNKALHHHSMTVDQLNPLAYEKTLKQVLQTSLELGHTNKNQVEFTLLKSHFNSLLE